ncbi:hypothetical protein GCM10027265_45040 [Jatrophihabitans fulvus]
MIASDLDLTLIYSRRAIARWGGEADAVAAVEVYQGADSAFMTANAAARLARLGDRVPVVPTTTRTPEQLARVRLPGAGRYAVAANGGILLVDGEPDPDWGRVVAQRLRGGLPVDDVHAHALQVCAPEWTTLVRVASELFVYAVLDRAALPDGFVDEQTAWADAHGWRVSLQGRKLYWVPRGLTKSAAVAEVAARLEAGRVLAAGDSLLDSDLLSAADAAIAARHGELVEADAVPGGVEVTGAVGIDAGEEIVAWFAASLVPVG